MKKLLLLCLTLILSLQCKSQVVFCPPGAEWHYLFFLSGFLPGNTLNETIKYTGDTIEGIDTLKILRHKRFFLQCSPLVNRTLIKQKGDTIFFKNSRTQNAWQILYNFATQPGQSWTTSVLQNDASISTFTYTVDSVKQINVNGFNLKRLFITKGTFPFVPFLGVPKTHITERFGSSSFLFDFDNSQFSLCDLEDFGQQLCYQDSSFGITQFSSKSCEYSTRNTIGITESLNEQVGIRIYPNPMTSELIIETNSTENAQLILTDVYGKELKQIDCENTARIDVSDLRSGIYFVSIKQNGSVIQNTKLVKE